MYISLYTNDFLLVNMKKFCLIVDRKINLHGYLE